MAQCKWHYISRPTPLSEVSEYVQVVFYHITSRPTRNSLHYLPTLRKPIFPDSALFKFITTALQDEFKLSRVPLFKLFHCRKDSSTEQSGWHQDISSGDTNHALDCKQIKSKQLPAILRGKAPAAKLQNKHFANLPIHQNKLTTNHNPRSCNPQYSWVGLFGTASGDRTTRGNSSPGTCQSGTWLALVSSISGLAAKLLSSLRETAVNFPPRTVNPGLLHSHGTHSIALRCTSFNQSNNRKSLPQRLQFTPSGRATFWANSQPYFVVIK